MASTRYYARAITIQEFMKTMPVVEIDIFTHEGFIAYANGVEVGRFNLPTYVSSLSILSEILSEILFEILSKSSLKPLSVLQIVPVLLTKPPALPLSLLVCGNAFV